MGMIWIVYFIEFYFEFEALKIKTSHQTARLHASS